MAAGEPPLAAGSALVWKAVGMSVPGCCLCVDERSQSSRSEEEIVEGLIGRHELVRWSKELAGYRVLGINLS